jgi:hypothetical protein
MGRVEVDKLNGYLEATERVLHDLNVLDDRTIALHWMVDLADYDFRVDPRHLVALWKICWRTAGRRWLHCKRDWRVDDFYPIDVNVVRLVEAD